jgi:pyruvate formate lyase activating enzyme
MREARWWDKLENGAAQCRLCPHACIILSGGNGKCRARKNVDGVLFASTFGRTVSLSVDPIEKKPLYHFLPGEGILSLGHNSCNLSCLFCQNHEISQEKAPEFPITPRQLATHCQRANVRMVAFTYTEPLTGLEFIIDSGRVLHEEGIKVVLVTNGFVNPEPFEEALPWIDAMNIDLKAFTDRFYDKTCEGALEPVLNTIRRAHQSCHIEVTTLLVTNENDGEQEIRDLAAFLADLDPNLPLHLSRYFPRHLMTAPPTPVSTMHRAAEIARERLRYVYLGNLPGDNDTLCPDCGLTLIRRSGYHVRTNGFDSGVCPRCGAAVHGVWRV